MRKRFHFWDSSSSPGVEVDETRRLTGCFASSSGDGLRFDEGADTSETDSSETPDVASESACPFVSRASGVFASAWLSLTSGGGAGAFLFFTADDNEASDVLDT